MKRKEKTLEKKSAAARALTTNYSREDEAANASTVRIPQTDNNVNTSSALLFVTSPRSKIFRKIEQQSNFSGIKKQLRNEGHCINLRKTFYEKKETSAI